MTSGGGPPGLGEDAGEVGLGHISEARACYDTMAKVMKRLAEIRDKVHFDSINVVDQHHGGHDQSYGEDV